METQKRKLKIAVVILNWNGKYWLEKFLPTVVQYSKDATIIIADNAYIDIHMQSYRNQTLGWVHLLVYMSGYYDYRDVVI